MFQHFVLEPFCSSSFRNISAKRTEASSFCDKQTPLFSVAFPQQVVIHKVSPCVSSNTLIRVATCPSCFLEQKNTIHNIHYGLFKRYKTSTALIRLARNDSYQHTKRKKTTRTFYASNEQKRREDIVENSI